MRQWVISRDLDLEGSILIAVQKGFQINSYNILALQSFYWWMECHFDEAETPRFESWTHHRTDPIIEYTSPMCDPG